MTAMHTVMCVVLTACFAACLPLLVRGQTAAYDDSAPTPSPSPFTDPPCPQERQWSATASQCCPLCPAGTGAIGDCVSPAFSDSSSNKDEISITPSSSNSSSSSSSSNPEKIVVQGCQLCVEGLTYSADRPHTDRPCRACSPCPKHARPVHACNSTHDTACECEAGLFYLSARTGQCELCDLCPAGWGARRACDGHGNTVCHKCVNGTYSDVLSAAAPCRPCRGCAETQRALRGCSATEDTVCLSKYVDIPPMYRFNGKSGGSHHHDLDLAQGHLNGDDDQRRQQRPGEGGRNSDDDDGGIDVIPLYCAALGAVVVGLVVYVAFVHYRRMRDKRLSREPHEDVEYSKASAGATDSGVFVDPDHHQQQHPHQQQSRYPSAVMTGSTRIRDLPQNKRKELEKTYLAGSRGPADWKGLARELGYNSGKIASFESRGGSQRDPGAPYRHVLQDWSRLEGATVAALLRALRNSGRHDVVKFLQAECAEQLQPLTSTLPQNVV